MGVTLGPLLAYDGDIGALSEPFRCRNALNCKCDGYMCRLGGAKSENVEKPRVFVCFFEGSRTARLIQEDKRPSGREQQGGGRGRVNPSPCGLVLRFGRFGGFGGVSKHLHA